MSLMLDISSIVYDKEVVTGEYDEQSQMWSTYAKLSSISDLPASMMTGGSSTSKGDEDDTKT